MITLSQDAPAVETETEPEIDPADWLAHCEQTRAACPPAEDATWLHASEWIACRAAYLRGRAERYDPIGSYALMAAHLAQVSRTLRGQHARGVLAYDRPVKVPAAYRYDSPLAQDVILEAGLLWPHNGAAARIAARALVSLADEIERLEADTAEEYLIEEAAARAREMDQICRW